MAKSSILNSARTFKGAPVTRRKLLSCAAAALTAGEAALGMCTIDPAIAQE